MSQPLTLTWSYAWAEFKKRCPDATYEVKKDENGAKIYKNVKITTWTDKADKK